MRTSIKDSFLVAKTDQILGEVVSSIPFTLWEFLQERMQAVACDKTQAEEIF